MNDDFSSDEDDDWFEHDLDRDVLASLELLVLTLDRARTDHLYWKWAILSSHNALQGVCVGLLTHTDGTGALESKWETELRRYHNYNSQRSIVEALGGEWVMGDLPHPEVKLAGLPDLLKRLPAPHQVTLPDSAGLTGANTEAQALYRLHEARNYFAHFGELNWQIIKPYFHNIIRVSVRKTRALLIDLEPRRRRDWDKDRLLTLLRLADSELDEIKAKLIPVFDIEH